MAARPEQPGRSAQRRPECRRDRRHAAPGADGQAPDLGRDRGGVGRRAGGTALSARRERSTAAAAAGLRVHAYRTPAARRDAAAAPPRVLGTPSRRLPLHAVLRDLPAVAPPPRTHDAPGPPRRREGLRLLRGGGAVP